VAKGKGGAAAPVKVEVNRRANGKAPKKNPKAPDAGKSGHSVGGYKVGTPKAERWTAEHATEKRRARAAARAGRRQALAAARKGPAKKPRTEG
jgi:hypothetical protein